MPSITEQLAAVAHLCWCASMQDQGWQYGSEYDPRRKTHDALISFDRLPEKDRLATVFAVKSAEVERYLATLVCYPRGPERPFDLAELRDDLSVGLAKDLDPAGTERGRVTGWKVGPDGLLQEIRVRWSDGTEQTHHPSERELRRLD